MKIIKKIYYRIEFELSSAMAVGSGEDNYSDRDIIRDSAGHPFIPGSTLAGIYRNSLGKADRSHYFGDELKNGKIVEEERPGREDRKRQQDDEQKIRESKVLVYDAKLTQDGETDSCHVSIRDCVGLDEWKTVTGREGCKFDFEVVEPGSVFVTYLEQNCGSGDRDICADLAALWEENRFHIGHKTMRGLGTVNCRSVRRREFFMTDQEDESSATETRNGIEQWLDFDMYDDRCWEASEWNPEKNIAGTKDKELLLSLTLKQRGGISIRRYTTEICGDSQKKAPDYEQVVYRRKGGKEIPFIPGTTWAGAFKHHMEKLLPESTGEYFGICVKQAGTDQMLKKKSKVWFSESVLRDAESKVLTRTAIDRFTGGVVRNSLFTERMWYGGTAELEIGFPLGVSEAFKAAMAASIVDLHMGMLPVGGQTSIGRGIFELVELKVNGTPVTISSGMYQEVLDKMKGAKHER